MRAARRWALISAACLAGLALAALALNSVRAAPLTADLSDHLIKITTGFTGTDVLLFGATDGPGDVIVVVRGPAARTAVRRKHRVAGIWVNRSQVVFSDAPSFYAVAASRPLEELMGTQALKRHQLGPWGIKLTAEEEDDDGLRIAYQAALNRIRSAEKLYQLESKKVRFLGEQLFRVDITFPSNVPTGIYTVQVFLVRDGDVVTAQTTPLKIEKHGFDYEVFEFAHTHSALYGLFAIALALAAGWLASVVFRRS
ncbi:MAG: TIGR02186 family protein [Alphaproteobacteria bacterium]|nr:TIGR02186 family protein [Alphaproteobacteria bacterium]